MSKIRLKNLPQGDEYSQPRGPLQGILADSSLLIRSSRVRLSPLREVSRFRDDMAVDAPDTKEKKTKKSLFKKSYSAQEFPSDTIVSQAHQNNQLISGLELWQFLF